MIKNRKTLETVRERELQFSERKYKEKEIKLINTKRANKKGRKKVIIKTCQILRYVLCCCLLIFRGIEKVYRK